MNDEVKLKVSVDGRAGEIALEQIFNKFNRLFEIAGRAKESIETSLSNMGNVVSGLNQGIELAEKIIAVLSKPVSLAIDFEQAQVSFEVLLGSASAAKDKIAELKEDSAKTPYQFADLQQATKVMLNFGITAGQVRPLLMMLGDIAGGDSQKLSSLALVMGQVSSAGKLQGQDLLQLINAGFNPLQEISRTTNKSMGELRREMEAGKISYDMVTGAFKSATGEGGRFHNMMEKQSHTLGGLISTVKDYIDQGLVKLANSGLFDVIKQQIEAISKYYTENEKTIDEFLNIFGTAIGLTAQLIVENVKNIMAVFSSVWEYKDIILGIASAVAILTAAINTDVIALKLMYAWDALVAAGKTVMTVVTNGLTIAQAALNVVMNMSPIGWILTTIGLVVTVLTVVIGRTIGWGKAFEYLKAGLLIAWDYMKGFGNFVIQFATGLTQLLTLPYQVMYRTAVEMFSKIGSMMKKLVTGDFSGLWEDIKSGFVTGFNDTVKSTINSFQSAFNSFDGLGDKAKQRWADAGKEEQKKSETKSNANAQKQDSTNNNKDSGPWKEDKAAIDKLEAEKKRKEAQAKDSIENELELQQKLLDIDRQYDLLKVKYEKEHENERTSARAKINADYDAKQAELNKKKREALQKERKEELDAAWELRSKELQYFEATDLEMLENKKAYLETVRGLYKQGTKEYLAAQREISNIDFDILIETQRQRKTQQTNSREINTNSKRLQLTQSGNEQELERFDSKVEYDKEIEELQKKYDKDEITSEDYFKGRENAETAHQQRLLEIKTKYYDNWLGRLANLSRAELDAAKQIIDNIGDVFGKIGNIVGQNAKDEADSTKASQKDKIEADREKALSYARTQQQKDKINKEYDAKEKKMEDEADKRARDKAADWFAIQKAASITSAIISTYEGANKTIAQGGFWGIALSIATIAAGLANVAVIAAQPLPKYSKGIIGINGPGTETSDSIPAWLSKNESIINADSTRAASPVLRLINSSAVMARRINDFVFDNVIPAYISANDYNGNSPISGSHVSGNVELLGEIRTMNKYLRKQTETPPKIRLEVGSDFATKMYRMGAATMRKESLS